MSRTGCPVSVAERWRAIIAGEHRGPWVAPARAALRALSGLTWLALHANLGVYDLGLARRRHVPCPVVVVGNLTLGGTGKTTTTAYLVRRLAAAGRTAGVILRGYRRPAGRPPLLVSDGHGLQVSACEAGDEAALLAQLLPGHPVAVGVRREHVAALILGQTQADALVLDDGFQYFRLARDADIVLIDATHDLERDRLFPAGTLREPHDHLARATQFWITHSELVSEARVAQLRQWLSTQAPGKPVVVTCHRGTGMRAWSGEGAVGPGSRVLALSGLGNPRSFEGSLAQMGHDVHALRFADHHRYAPEDWERVREAAERCGAAAVITTEKDSVKLPPPPTGLPPVHVLQCGLELVEGHAHVEALVEGLSA